MISLSAKHNAFWLTTSGIQGQGLYKMKERKKERKKEWKKEWKKERKNVSIEEKKSASKVATFVL